ncbi:hypothetical protein KJS94_05245 [Flavihumibacter rivuli]|uniref:baeRF3 domain-containing protein n=1 Tax=Flavihumibacter rivuli TaxID=2838156 RepID=UPI001BDE2C0C|nr:hypothetical protein [Flavihumibacter rivuli]ULQ57604.1 hypothetical protein KJS94_05245 [Flavihumibacter rivuli]
MTKESLLGENLVQLKQGQGNICVSIIIPTHRFIPERQGDRSVMEKAIAAAKLQLHQRYDKTATAAIERSIEALAEGIDYNHNMDGIGLFVSGKVQLLEKFHFPIEEKVLVSDRFEIRDLLYQLNYSKPYFLLMLTENDARLFQGQLDQLAEVKDNNFPREYTDSYLYEHPSRSSSYSGYAGTKGFEKDKSFIEAERHEKFFQSIDHILDNYLVQGTALVVTAVTKELAWYEKVTRHQSNIIGTIEGNYTYQDQHILAGKAWDIYRNYRNRQKQDLVKDFEEKIGEGHGLEQLENVWEAAWQGRGLKLLVEKDFRKPGFIDPVNASRLHLKSPLFPHEVIPDAVDKVIETVLEKNGEVYFVEQDSLKDHGHIALITRY